MFYVEQQNKKGRAMKSESFRFREIFDFLGQHPTAKLGDGRNLRLHKLAECATAFCFHSRSQVTARLIWPFEPEAFHPGAARENMVLGVVYLIHEYHHRDREADLREVLGLMVDERYRQCEVEGWSDAHDDQRASGDMAMAAAAYCMTHSPVIASLLWPWEEKWFKPKDWRRNYIRAGALMLAEWERLGRLNERMRLMAIHPPVGKGEKAEG